MIDDIELDRRLHAADRGELAARVAPESLDARLAEAKRAKVQRPPRRRWSPAAVAGGIAIVCFGAVPAAAGAYAFLAQTGEFCIGNECGSAPEEFIEVSAADFDDWLKLQAPADYELPSSLTVADASEAVSDTLRMTAGDVVTRRSAEVAYVFFAVCEWSSEWLAADQVENTEGRASATRQLVRLLGLPVMHEIDGDGGFTASNQRYQSAAETGDRDGIEAAKSAFCAHGEGSR